MLVPPPEEVIPRGLEECVRDGETGHGEERGRGVAALDGHEAGTNQDVTSLPL